MNRDRGGLCRWDIRAGNHQGFPRVADGWRITHLHDSDPWYLVAPPGLIDAGSAPS